MADHPKMPRNPEETKCSAGQSKTSSSHRRHPEGLEMQNAIYREVFSKANIKYPELKKLDNYRIPKKSSSASSGKFDWTDDEDGKGTKVKWVEEPAPEKHVQKSILELPYKDVEEYEQERLKGGYNRRPRPLPTPEPSTSNRGAPRRKAEIEPKTLIATSGSSSDDSSLAATRAPVRPRHRFQSDRNGDFDRSDYASAVGSMNTITTKYMAEKRNPVTELGPLLAAGQTSSVARAGAGAAGGEQEGDRNSESMDTGENRED